MKKITFLSILALCLTALSFTSCNSDSDSFQYPTQTEAYNMMVKIAGTGFNSGKIIFPGDSIDKETQWKTDSTYTTVTINPRDSSYTISDFPVSKLANYVKKAELSSLIAKLPNQTIKGKLLAVDKENLGFGTVTDNIKFTNSEGKEVQLAFYGGYTNYSLAGITQNKKNFVLYLTPGAIYVDKKLQDDAIRTYTSYGYTLPYIVRVVYSL